MTAVAIRRADVADADDLGVIGPASYLAAYDYLWDDPVALLRHLHTFNAHAFRSLLGRADARVWVAELNGASIGFLAMLVGSPDPIFGGSGGAEIPRIYLLSQVRKRGLGRRLFDAAVDQARFEGLTYVWLDVMDSAGWAVSAYRRWGLVPIGTDRFDKGTKPEYSGMIVMSMTVGDVPV